MNSLFLTFCKYQTPIKYCRLFPASVGTTYNFNLGHVCKNISPERKFWKRKQIYKILREMVHEIQVKCSAVILFLAISLQCFLFIHPKHKCLILCRLDDCYWVLEIRIPKSSPQYPLKCVLFLASQLPTCISLTFPASHPHFNYIFFN